MNFNTIWKRRAAQLQKAEPVQLTHWLVNAVSVMRKGGSGYSVERKEAPACETYRALKADSRTTRIKFIQWVTRTAYADAMSCATCKALICHESISGLTYDDLCNRGF